ncbi:MAG: LOG family protein [Chloroflexota bacterium]
MGKVISVFGSSQPKPGTAVYELSKRLGRQLAEAGFTVATGGYYGTMGAVSEGAAEANGHIIGVTSGQIERQFNVVPNQWITEEIRYVTLRERLMHLVLQNDAMITLPGGIGTLSEMSMAWSFIQTGELPERPFVLIGDMWPKTVKAFAHSAYVRDEYVDYLTFVDSTETAVAALEGYWA